MFYSAQEIIEAATALENLENQVSTAIEVVNTQISELLKDPGQPNAKNQYDNIVVLREQTVSYPWNNSAPSLITNLNNVVAGATAQAVEQTKTLVSSVQSKQGTVTVQGINQRDVKLPELLNAINKANDPGIKINSNLVTDDNLATITNTGLSVINPATSEIFNANSNNNQLLTVSLNPNTSTNSTTPASFQNTLIGSADGDNLDTPSATQAGIAEGVPTGYSSATYSVAQDPKADYVVSAAAGANAPGTGNQPSDTSSNTDKVNRPGIRLQNPLSFFASWTYNISLYMITPESYNAFIATSRKNIYANPDGVFLVAQSGGINNQTQQRAPGFELDFYIDDLKIKTTTNGKSTTTATNVTELSFTIYEPYGFSFFSNLRKATIDINAKTNIPGAAKASNPLKQFFVVGLKFVGYDIDGNIISSDDVNGTDLQNGFLKGIAEKFFDINITDVKFRLDGKMSTYRITAATLAPSQGFGLKRGRIDHRFSITADNVYNALIGPEGLLTKLNEEQVGLTKNVNPQTKKPAMEHPNVYDVKVIGETTILQSKLRTKDKFRFASANVSKTVQSNDAASSKAPVDPNKLQITFENDTPIQLAISNIISQSSYMDDALKSLQTEAPEPTNSGNPNEDDIEVKNTNATFQWYNLGVVLEPYAYDNIINDWAYKITYVIQPYLAPNLISPYAGNLPNYYGPHKRYEYWYTGKNSEVISFEQDLNNAYFMVALNPETTGASKDAGISYKAGVRQNEDKTGKRNEGKESENSVLTSLNSPGDWAESKVTIMGDPDFLIQDSPDSVNDVYNQFYGKDGVTINANGGQVFVEIDFKEGVDYDHNVGLLTLNETITFWQDYTRLPKNLREQIKGISFMVIDVDSMFSKGKFTQTLSLTINTFPQADKAQSPANQRPETTSQTTANDARTPASQGDNFSPTSTNGSGTSTNKDLLPDQPITDFAYPINDSVEGNRQLIGGVTQTDQIVTPTAKTTESPILGVQEPIVYAGTTTIEGGIDDSYFVADDDGTVDQVNIAIIQNANKRYLYETTEPDTTATASDFRIV